MISCARVAELVDALDLGSSGVTRGGSTPPLRTYLTSMASHRGFFLLDLICVPGFDFGDKPHDELVSKAIYQSEKLTIDH